MTDTTDKLSLQQLKDVRELCLPHTAWRLIIDELISARDQLEAERQRADRYHFVAMSALEAQAEISEQLGISEDECDGSTEQIHEKIEMLQTELAALKTDIESYIGIGSELATEVEALKGDQVPVAWTSQRSLETKNKIVAFTDDMSALDYGVANGWTDIVELFTTPQKPVVLRPHLHPSHSYASVAVSGRDEQWYAAIEAAGGSVKDGE